MGKSADEVDAAIDAIARRDEELGRAAADAAMTLMAGEGTDVLSQATFQETLWWRVPKRYPDDAWHDFASGAAALFDELGLDRYAAIARSKDTQAVFEAWSVSRTAGHRSALAARGRSGVAVPDTSSVTWSTVYGNDEAEALDACERALEAAIVAGELVPGARGNKAIAVAITERTLTEPLDLPPGQTHLTLVTTERVETWVRGGRDDQLRTWRESIARRILMPIDVPEDADAVTEPMRWLLAHVGAGVTLTQNGYLPRAIVLEATERFDWWHDEKPPRSEVDLFALSDLRDLAVNLRLIKVTDRRASLTTRGKAALTDAVQRWNAVADGLGGTSEFDAAIAECLAMALLDGPEPGISLSARVAPGVLAMGWRSEAGPVHVGDVQSRLHRLLHHWRAIGVVDHHDATWEQGTGGGIDSHSDRLSPGGESAALTFLRRRAAGPKSSPFG